MDKIQLKNDAQAFLNDQSVGVISTVDKDNIPESATVNYLLDSDWMLYIITDKNSRKIQNLRQNSHIAFVVGTSSIPNTAQIQGIAEIIESTNELYNEIAQKLSESKRLEKDPIYDIFGNNYVYLKITIEWLRWLYFDKTNGNPVYTILIPQT